MNTPFATCPSVCAEKNHPGLEHEQWVEAGCVCDLITARPVACPIHETEPPPAPSP